jgi:NADPH:quinone reductase-like Zn-dependent oxidoreductase
MVQSVGAAVADLRPGDRVCYLSNTNGYANYLRLPATSVCAIPDDLASVDAATLPVGDSTALVCFERANLQRGDTVLIHTASGAVGLACIAMAKHMGGLQDLRHLRFRREEDSTAQVADSSVADLPTKQAEPSDDV